MTWLMRPIQLPAAAIASNSGGVGLPIANLLSPQPKQVFALAIEAAWSLAISVDLGADTAIDTLAMLFHNGDAAGGWRAYYRTAAQGPAPGHFDDTGSTLWFALTSWRLASVVSPAPARRHALHAGEAVTARYLKIYMVSPAGANPAWFVGCLSASTMARWWGWTSSGAYRPTSTRPRCACSIGCEDLPRQRRAGARQRS